MEKLKKESLLDTESGMLQMELERLDGDFNTVIDAAEINDDIKNECRKVIQGLKDKLANAGDSVEVYDLTRGSVGGLLKVLEKKGEEEMSLFEALKDVAYKALYSVKGWKYPPEKI